MKVAVVGATGLVGTVMLEVLQERKFPVTEFLPVASERSVGKPINFNGKEYAIVSMEAAVAARPDVAIFSAGGAISKEWAPHFAAAGTTVIDNSSAWRMDPTKKLVVPEVNAHVLTPDDKIIANPNCSTIQMVVALEPLHKAFGIKRVVVSTYQSITGTGVKAVKQYQLEQKGFTPEPEEMAYKYQIFENVLPHIDVFTENGYTKEEMKMLNEGRKIMDLPDLRVSCTCVRVPVYRSHSVSITAQFERPVDADAARAAYAGKLGVQVVDDISNKVFPVPLDTTGKDDCLVGRIRKNLVFENALDLWVVGDQVRKGAALNAVQIAEIL